MEVKLAFLADGANVSREGKLNLLGKAKGVYDLLVHAERERRTETRTDGQKPANGAAPISLPPPPVPEALAETGK